MFDWLKRLFGHSALSTETLPPAANNKVNPSTDTNVDVHPDGYDPVVAHVQKVLSDHGYTEVGMIDGFPGPKLEAGIRNVQHENGMEETGTIDDDFLAFLPKMPVRQLNERRISATVGDLRKSGNPIVQGSDTVKWGGGLFGILGALGGVQSSGILDTAQNALAGVQGATSQASGILTTIGGGLESVISVVTWCASHWWLFAILAAVFVIYKAVVIAETQVIQFRQAFLTRKDAGSQTQTK